MRDWIPLSELACRPADANRVVARQADGKLRTHADFVMLVERWQCAFLAQERRVWALYVQDPLVFAAALFGAWHAGKEVLLPGDDRPATLAALREMGGGLAGDLPEGLQAAAPGGAVPARHP